MSFRRFIVPSLEELNTASSDVIDTKAVVDAVMDPAVANPPPVKDEPVVTEQPAAPAADAPATDSVADVNTPASTPEEPAQAETPPEAPAVTDQAPSSDGTTPAEPVAQPEAVPAASAPADAAPEAPVVDPVETPVVEQTNTPEVPKVDERQHDQTTPATTETPAAPEAATELSDDEISLEELDAEMELAQEIREEAELKEALTNDMAADDEVENQLAAVLESLEVLAENTANIIEADACTEQTAQIIEESAASNLQQVGVELQFPAMESYGGNIKIRHQMALENIDSYADRIRQMLDINVVQRIKQLSSTFSIYEAQVSKFQQNIHLLKEQYKKNKGNWHDKQHEGSLTAVGRFFNVNDGNVMSVLPDDLKTSEYVLTQYPDQIMKNIDELVKTLNGSKYRDDKEFVSFVKKFGGIKTQAEIFKMKDNSKIHALLGNAALIHSVGTLPKILSYGDESFPELADAAKYDAFEQFNAEYIMTILKLSSPIIAIGSLVIGVPSSVINVITAHKVVLTTDEIGKLLDYADKYAENCLTWSKTISKIINTYQKLDVAMKRFSSIGSDIGGITIGKRYRVWRILGQIKTIVRNQMRYVDTPTGIESYRSFMGAKYCYYLAKRFIVTAK